MEECHLVLLEQVKNAFIVLLNDRILACKHLLQVQTQALDLNSMLGECMARMFVMLG